MNKREFASLVPGEERLEVGFKTYYFLMVFSVPSINVILKEPPVRHDDSCIFKRKLLAS